MSTSLYIAPYKCPLLGMVLSDICLIRLGMSKRSFRLEGTAVFPCLLVVCGSVFGARPLPRAPPSGPRRSPSAPRTRPGPDKLFLGKSGNRDLQDLVGYWKTKPPPVRLSSKKRTKLINPGFKVWSRARPPPPLPMISSPPPQNAAAVPRPWPLHPLNPHLLTLSKPSRNQLNQP